MLLIVVNGVFSAFFIGFARLSLVRAVPLVRIGWSVIDAEVRKSIDPRNVETRRTVGEAGALLVLGLLWGVVALGSGGAALFFSLEALRLLA